MIDYAMKGLLNLSNGYENAVAKVSPFQWDKEYMDKQVDKVRNNVGWGFYPIESLDLYKTIPLLNLAGKRAAVIGTIYPWIEASLLLANVSHVTTIEYAKIGIDGLPKMSSIVPLDAARRAIDGTLEPFDFIASYSSIEHSGLGRFGDVVDPNGDLIEMLKCWCWLKPGGTMLIGLPDGMDHIVFNMHRIYGPLRWPLISAGFEVIGIYGPDGALSWANLKNDEWVTKPRAITVYQHRMVILRKKLTIEQ